MQRRGSFSIHTMLGTLAAIVVGLGVFRAIDRGVVGQSSRVQINFWNGFTGPDGIVMIQMIERFNRENPDVKVTMQRIPWATYYNKLTVAGSDGRGPQLFVVHASTLPRIRRAEFIADSANLYEGTNPISPGDFDPYVLGQVKFGAEYDGVPLDIHPQGLYCNAEMLRKAGLVDKEGRPYAPRNREEFVTALKAMTTNPPDSNEKTWGYALTAWGSNLRCLIPQFGGRYLDEKGNAELNSPQNIEALEFLGYLAKDRLVPPPENGLGWFGYRQKRVAMVWDGVFMLGDLLRLNDMEYIGAPIPTIGKQPGTMADSHVLCIRKGISNAERLGVERFVRFVSDNSLDWAAAGQVPARKSIRAMPAFAKMQVQSAFAKQIPWMMYNPRTPVLFEVGLELDLATEKVIRGTASAKDALDLANTNAQRIIERDRLEQAERVARK
jgi:multiple sugar transport system substrate-binding protein